MGKAIVKPVMDLWEKWSIRGLIIFSLTLQAILVFFAPSRKRTAKKLLFLLIWFAYLLADWSANYTVGQISDSQYDVENDGSPSGKNAELLAFWTPFLLLHLGGPDTITALAVEDNELWRRHLLGLICQAISSLYVLLLSIPNRLLVPMVLMFVAGLIKSVERTKALYAASLEHMQSMLLMPDPGPNYALLMEEYRIRKGYQRDTEVTERPRRELENLEVVLSAYKYFNIFKFLAFKSIISSPEVHKSKELFGSETPEYALGVLEVELSFMYDTYFTKVDILHTWIGAGFRFIGLGCLVAALCLFVSSKKDRYKKFDVNLTYALLIGGIALDLFAIITYCVSDWTVARLRKLDGKRSRVDYFLDWGLGLRKLKWRRCICCKGHELLLDREFLLRRWSESVPGYSVIEYCLRIRPDNTIHRTERSLSEVITQGFFINPLISYISRGIASCFIPTKQGSGCVIGFLFKKCRQMINYPTKLLAKVWLGIFLPLRCWIDDYLEFFGIRNQIDEMMYTSSHPLAKELWEFVYEEVRHKSSCADSQKSAKEIYSARGDWTLRRALDVQPGNEAENGELFKSVTEADYGKSILVWHIATELIYQSQAATELNYSLREHSKTLSDYMMYLLLMRPALMSKVSGIARMRIKDTCLVAKNLFEMKHLRKMRDARLATEGIMSLSTAAELNQLKGCQNKSVLYEAHVVAKELQELGNTWEVMSKVWVELLCYAATHCDSKQHIAQLRKGSQLISFVWLLLSHLALGTNVPTKTATSGCKGKKTAHSSTC